MLEIKVEERTKGPNLLVVGVGGGGNNAVDRMIESKIDEVHFAAVNTDVAVLDNCKAERKLQIGTKLLKGYGAGADPSMGEAAAMEDEENIRELVLGNDMVIVTCGLGGGTGTGAAPIIAKCCKDEGILTLGVVTLPFSFEGTPRMIAAKAGLQALRNQVDTLLVIPNDKLVGMTDKMLLLDDAFQIADSILQYTIEGISNIVYNRGIVNIDFNDVKTTLKGKGVGHLSIGTAKDKEPMMEAVKRAVNSPLLTTSIEGAANILVNVSGKVDVFGLNEAVNYIRELAGEQVNIIWGTVKGKEAKDDTIVVTLIATGMPEEKPEEKPSKGVEAVMPPQVEIPQTVRRPFVPVGITTGTSTLKKPKQVELEIPAFLSKYKDE